GAEQVGPHVDGGADQCASRGCARGDDAAGPRKSQADELLADGDEIAERVELVRQPSRLVPGFSILAAATHMRDDVDEAALHQRQPRRAELRVLLVAVSAVTLQPDRRRAVELSIPAIEQGGWNPRPVLAGSVDAARHVACWIVAARHLA